jgi:putative heme iron utilization protein
MAANQERNFYREAAMLLAAARMGTLATTQDGAPYAALVTPALDGDGAPVLLLSELAAHTRNLRANPACALLVTGPAPEENPQTAARILLSAIAEQSEAAEARKRFLQTHPYASLYAGFADFSIWRLIVKDAHYVGGFAAASRLDVAALQHEIKSVLKDGCG